MGKEKEDSENITESTNNYLIPNLDRALSILEELAKSPGGLGVSDLAQRVHIPKNSAFRILYTLNKRGYVEQSRAGKLYHISYRLHSLGHAAIEDSTRLERAIPLLYKLRDQINETVLYGVLHDGEGVILEQIPGNNIVRCTIPVGYRFLLHTSAPGKIFLAWSSDHQREKLIERIKFERYTSTTIMDAATLRKELNEVRKQGYALDRGEMQSELRCIAVPIYDSRANVEASVWVNAPSFRVTEADLVSMASKLQEVAKEISMRFGWNGTLLF